MGCGFFIYFTRHCTTIIVFTVHRSTSGIGAFRDQGLSNSVVVKFITEFDKLFQQDGETSVNVTTFMQWVSCLHMALHRTRIHISCCYIPL